LAAVVAFGVAFVGSIGLGETVLSTTGVGSEDELGGVGGEG